MTIFNSLGSNYDLKFALKALFTQDQKKYSIELKNLIKRKYKRETILFYKGREAIKAALKQSNFPKGSFIAINGFTCWAVYEAIVTAGYNVEYLDLEDRNLNFTAEVFQKSINKNPKIKAVIIQNTLGYPCEISKIAKICRENGVVLIEDLAHSVGTMYEGKKEAGSVGDLTILSFSQDKIIDGVSGGALVIRNKKYADKISQEFQKLRVKSQIKDRLYPLFTYLIRSTYSITIGKILHSIFRKLNLLSKPIENASTDQQHFLPSWYCSLAKSSLEKLESDIKHRRNIANIYAKNIKEKILSEKVVSRISNSTNLRFPIFVKNRESLTNLLKENCIYVSDIWYDAPIAPKKFLRLTNYKNQCPNAEIISEQIVNLPTHKNVSIQQAEIICQKINEWLKSQ